MEEVDIVPSSQEAGDDLEEISYPFFWPSGKLWQVLHILGFPIKLVNWATIPNLKKWLSTFFFKFSIF